MKILILNQAFYPDVVSTAQHATDLALELVKSGHEVTVICSRRGYDDPGVQFSSRETWHGIRILRIWSTSFGKTARWRRAVDFASIILGCAARLLMMRRVDVMVSLTSPPLISFIAALAVPRKAQRLVLWMMDLNPDEAIAAGWLKRSSLVSRLLSRMLVYSLNRADRVIALDRFMKDRIQAKAIADSKITVIPPWSHDDQVHFDAAGRDEFRAQHGVAGKFVVMYSGNHSPCHPLDTLMAAAERLAARPDIVFCFIGGGSEFRKIKERVRAHKMENLRCIPYQPLARLSASLSAADLHVVVLGNAFVGVVHPSKIYNILAVGRPFLYIGPRDSHVADIMTNQLKLGHWREHSDVDGVVSSILEAQACRSSGDAKKMSAEFSRNSLVPQLVAAIEGIPRKAVLRYAVDGCLAAERHD